MRRLTIFVLLISAQLATAEEIRIATYNIRFLDAAQLPTQGSRQSRLQAVIQNLNADVVGLQEIDDRAALEAIFDPAAWSFVIDNESNHNQDVALAFRRAKLTVANPADGDADNAHFLFNGSVHNSEFPNRRDALNVELTVTTTGDKFRTIVLHAKSRHGGRANTDHRRERMRHESWSRKSSRILTKLRWLFSAISMTTPTIGR